MMTMTPLTAALALWAAAFAGSVTLGANASAPKGPLGELQLTIHLADGSKIAGNLVTRHLVVDTDFGQLKVPIDRIHSFTPGLKSRPDELVRIKELIDNLSADEVERRDQAQRVLLGIGLPLRQFLATQRDDKDPERKGRIETIIEELDESLEADEAASEARVIPIVVLDTIETAQFTIVGTISAKTFKVESRYGALTVQISDIRHARRNLPEQPRELRRTVTVEGNRVAPQKLKDSGVRVARGQTIKIKANGEIRLTPWGNKARSGPHGAPNYGWYIPNEIPVGALVVRIGDSGAIVKVGESLSFKAKHSGTIQLGIAMHRGHAQRNFPGEYEVKLRVLPLK